jgi:hypothetical protein
MTPTKEMTCLERRTRTAPVPRRITENPERRCGPLFISLFSRDPMPGRLHSDPTVICPYRMILYMTITDFAQRRTRLVSGARPVSASAMRI